MQAGDIAFFHGSNAPTDRLIRHFTGDDTGFSHCAVVLTPEMFVEALLHGITLDDAREPDGLAPTGAALTMAGLRRGRSFLMSEVGRAYGMLDIAADVFQLVLPQSLGSRTPFLVMPSQFDCSALATQFLVEAGFAALPQALMSDPHRVSPNGLARALGVIK